VAFDIRRLHEGRRNHVQQLPGVRHGSVNCDVAHRLRGSVVRQQIRHRRPGLRHFLHHRSLRRHRGQLAGQRQTLVIIKHYF